MESDCIRIPGISDREVRRFRVFCFDFDARANILADEPKESWSQEAKVQWQTSRDSLIESLKLEFGAHDIDRKVADFAALGTKPFSIIAHHNALFDQVRSAFVPRDKQDEKPATIKVRIGCWGAGEERRA